MTSDELGSYSYDSKNNMISSTKLVNNTVLKCDNGDVFGNNLASGNITFNPRFAGQYFDFESDLHYNISRTYNPATGRYMQSDPLGLLAGSNTYNYVGRNPMNNVDPLGLDVVIFLDDFTTGFFGGTSIIGHIGLGVTGFDGNIWHNEPNGNLVRGDFIHSTTVDNTTARGGFMNSDNEDSSSYIRIKTTSEQDSKLIDFLNKSLSERKIYHFPFYDCVTFVKNALDYAHIKYYYPNNPLSYSKSPNILFLDIKANNKVIESGTINHASFSTDRYEKQILQHILRP